MSADFVKSADSVKYKVDPMPTVGTVIAHVGLPLTTSAIWAEAQKYSPVPEARDGGGQRYWPRQHYLSANGDIVPHGEHSGYEEDDAALAGGGGRCRLSVVWASRSSGARTVRITA